MEVLKIMKETFEIALQTLTGSAGPVMFNVKTCMLKKWKYAQPRQVAQNLFVELPQNLYLLGDAFGGPSINGAVRSAIAVAESILEKS
jgi:predicted NAD/FAD-dependent oxidoreductase